jgi:imidazoleglycerol-phosphate dehydratase
MSAIARDTNETSVRIELLRDDSEREIATSVPFLDHMLNTFMRYAGLGCRIRAQGDLRHHIIEDVAITLGLAVLSFVSPTAARYGHRVIPMDDALVEATIDVGGRAYYRGPLPSALYDHFFRSFSENAKHTLHVRVIRGSDRHHVVEAAFKAVGLALRDALEDSGAVFSTKGAAAVRLGADDDRGEDR